jgi:FKBP-type peptidyl-prolyl cis-trans isomerase
MKKTLLIGLTLSSSLLLTACGSKEDAPTNEPLTPTTETEQTAVLPDTNNPTLSDNNELTMDCKTTIQTYLAEANLEGQGETIIQANDSVVVDYIGRLDEENVFDTSVEKVAKACGKYTE